MILHDYILSASCYKIRLMAALLEIRLDLQAVDFHPGRQHKSPAFRTLNPAGTLPVLQDGDLILTETTAMLVHLAQGTDWLGPPVAQQHWLAFSARLNASLGAARLHDMLNHAANISACRRDGRQALREMESHLTEARFHGQIFLNGPAATIADIACFPNVALAPDGGVSLGDYPSVRLWTRAIRSLPRFIEMPGIPRLHDLTRAP